MSTSIPAVPRTSDAETRKFLEAVKEILEVGALKRGNQTEQFVRMKDLVDSGMARLNRNGTLIDANNVNPPDRLDIRPPEITNLQVATTFTRVLLTWDFAGVETTLFEIKRSLSTETLADADPIGVSNAEIFADASVDLGVEYKYYVRAVTETGKTSGWVVTTQNVSITDDPFSQIVNASAGLPLAEVQTALAGTQGFGMIQNSNGEKAFAVLADRFGVYDGTDGAVQPFQVVNGEVYINTAVINTASITSAMIESVSADKITADNLAAIDADLGNITAGTLKGPNNRFQIDLGNNVLKVYDASGTLRVQIGDLS